MTPVIAQSRDKRQMLAGFKALVCALPFPRCGHPAMFITFAIAVPRVQAFTTDGSHMRGGRTGRV
jgi:hypothetical protein